MPVLTRFFGPLAQRVAQLAGRVHAFALALFLVALWAATGPLFGYSNTWQLIINTGANVTAVLMMFLIQNTQNRNAQALQLKLDELIRVHEGARNRLLTLEDLTEEELDQVKTSFTKLAARHPEVADELGQARLEIEAAEEHLEAAEGERLP